MSTLCCARSDREQSGVQSGPDSEGDRRYQVAVGGGLGDEFAAVFGGAADYDFFVDFANAWGQQIEAREAMTKATGRPAPLIPSQVDAQTYFAAVTRKGNSEVFDAYQSFASAFFVHRGIASVADLRLKFSDLFSAKASITGRRGLVCTGFATMGARFSRAPAPLSMGSAWAFTRVMTWCAMTGSKSRDMPLPV